MMSERLHFATFHCAATGDDLKDILSSKLNSTFVCIK